jgi:uncharacterized phage-associated protein
MIHSAEHIAEYLIFKSNTEEGGEFLSNMKLQKLLYYCQGFYYSLYKEPLFHEKIYAWQYGPVVTEIYHKYKSYSAAGIPSPKTTTFDLTDNQKEMIDEVYGYFGQFSAIKLMNMTHSEAPWVNTPISDEIELNKLENYFLQFLTKDDEKN